MSLHARIFPMLAAALGPIGSYLIDPEVVEIMANPDGTLWVETLGNRPALRHSGLTVAQREQVIRIVASSMDLECHATYPSLAATLPESGARFQAFLPPLVSAPAFVIRLPAIQVFTLEDYTREGMMTSRQRDILHTAVSQCENILIAGGSGSGKTTLANALLACMAQTGDRIVTIEDTPELQCPARNTLALYTRPGIATMQHLVKDTMRARPDRIVIGEVRDGAALDMLKAWTTGHPGGLCTLHANSAHDALVRLEYLVQEVSVSLPSVLIGNAIDLIVFMVRTLSGRTIESLQRCLGWETHHARYAMEVCA